jgi:hypothetical protein
MLSWFRALMPREERPMEYSAGIALDQSTLMPAALMIGHHLSISARAHERRSAVATGYPVNSQCHHPCRCRSRLSGGFR